MLGQILKERYCLEQQLGKNMGRRTFLARDLTNNQLVVIKLLRFGSDFQWSDLRLFEREAQTLQNLDLPAIPRYLDYFELNSPSVKGFALVQSYIEAKSLEAQLQGGRTFSESELKQIAKAVLEILIYLHQHQPPVIHRDIKPSNILLTNRSGDRVGEVYLVDFGSVQTLAAQQGGTITVVGTYGYMPPEQFGGRAVPASDLYSLGATLIYLATGRHPADLPQQGLRIQFEQFANLEPAFTGWLKWMTQPSLDKRLTSATEALQALEEERIPEAIANVAKKPAGSNVMLTKNAEALEITFPAIQSAFWLLFGMYVWISVVIAPLFLYLGSSTFTIGITFSSLGVFIILLSWHMYGIKKVLIDRQHISTTLQLFGFEYHPRRINISNGIDKLEYLQYIWLNKERSPQVIIRSILIIWFGSRGYLLSGIGQLTDPELEWLAYELSQWLEIPIARTTK